MEKKLSLIDKIIIMISCVIAIGGIIIMLPITQNFAIKIGESLAGRTLRDYSKWYGVITAYGFQLIFFAMFFSFLYFVFKVAKVKCGMQISTKNHIFLFVFFFITVMSIVQLFFGDKFLFYFHPFFNDSFGDLLYMVVSPYNSTYPPLSLVPFKIMHLIAFEYTFELRNNICGAFFLILYCFSVASIFLFSVFVIIKGDIKRKIFYSVLLLFSGVFIWATERANIMSFAFLLSFIFVSLYLSDEDDKRKLSYILLALAVCLKLYPGAFILLMIVQKDVKGIIYFMLHCALIFIFSYALCEYLDFLINVIYINKSVAYFTLPCHITAIFAIFCICGFLMYKIYKEDCKFLLLCTITFLCFIVIAGGFIYFYKNINFFAILKNIFVPILNAVKFGNNMTQKVEGVNVSIKNFILLIHYFVTGSNVIVSDSIIRILKIICIIFSIFAFAFNKTLWKKLACISFLCIYVPDFAAFYLLVYLILPLVFFINDATNDKANYFYAVLFAIIISFFVVPYNFKIPSNYVVTGSFVVIVFCVFILYVSLVVNAVYNFCTTKNKICQFREFFDFSKINRSKESNLFWEPYDNV